MKKNTILLGFISAGFLFAPLVSHAGKDNNNFLNGKPFAYMDQKIEVNTAAIEAVQQQADATAVLLTALESRVTSNEADINNTMSLISDLNADISVLSSQLHDLEVQHINDIATLRSDVSALRGQVTALTGSLNALASEVATQVSALRESIANNASNIMSQSVLVSLLTGRLAVAEANVSTMLIRISNAEQAINAQEAALQDLNGEIAALDNRVSLLGAGSQQNTVREIVLHDTASNDFSGTELKVLMAQLNVQDGDYIYVEGDMPGANRNAKYCAENASAYITGYQNGTSPYRTEITGANRWTAKNGGGWALIPAINFIRLYTGRIGDNSGHSWYLMTYNSYRHAIAVGFFPTRDTDYSSSSYRYSEINVNGDIGYSDGNSTLTFRVGTRKAACGF